MAATVEAERFATSAASNTIAISDSSCCDAERLFSTKTCTACNALIAVSCGTAMLGPSPSSCGVVAAAGETSTAFAPSTCGGGGAAVKPAG